MYAPVLLLAASATGLVLPARPLAIQPPAAALSRCAAAGAARQSLRPPAVKMAAKSRVVVTDMDETLIAHKSTGFVIKFLVYYRAYLRLLLVPFLAATLIPLSKLNRTLAVRLLYWFAFRGMRVDKAQRVAAGGLTESYADDLQDPAASAVLDADTSVVITASPDFMARPWLEKYMGVPPANVYGAVLEEKGGRFTGKTGELPIGDAKVELLQRSGVATAAAEVTGYGDHPTDVPFLNKCDRGVIVHPAGDEPIQMADAAPSCEYVRASPFDLSRLKR